MKKAQIALLTSLSLSVICATDAQPTAPENPEVQAPNQQTSPTPPLKATKTALANDLKVAPNEDAIKRALEAAFANGEGLSKDQLHEVAKAAGFTDEGFAIYTEVIENFIDGLTVFAPENPIVGTGSSGQGETTEKETPKGQNKGNNNLVTDKPDVEVNDVVIVGGSTGADNVPAGRGDAGTTGSTYNGFPTTN